MDTLELPVNNDEETLDVSSDCETIKKLDDTLVDLQNIFEEITSKMSVNKTLAIAIESVSPGLLSELTPVNSYTVDFSQTNYKATVESITIGTAGAIAAFIAAIALILVKIVNWIRRSISRSKDKREYNEKLTNNASVLVKEILKLYEKLPNEDKKQYLDIKEEISKESSDSFSSIHNDLLKDLIDGDKVKHALTAVSGMYDKYLEQVNAKITVFEDSIRIAKNNPNEESTILKVKARLSDQQLAINLGPANSPVDALIGVSTSGTVMESLVKMNDYINHLRESNTTKNFTYNYVFDLLRNDKVVLLDKFFKSEENSERNLAKVEERLNKLTNENDSKIMNVEVSNVLKEAANLIKKEIMGLEAYSSACNKVQQLNGQFADLLYETTNRHYKRILSELLKSNSDFTRNLGKESKRSIEDKKV